MFGPHYAKSDPERVSYYHHAALRFRFRRLDDAWYAELEPDCCFTSDGYKESSFADGLLAGIKRLDRLAHAVRVALKVGEHLPDSPPGLVAVALLHDSPEFAPQTEDLDAMLVGQFGARVACVVRALQQEHQFVGDEPVLPCDPWVLYVSAADKIVSIGSVLRRGMLADDPDRYWRHTRRAFVARLPYFRAFHTLAGPHLPAAMAGELGRLVARAELSATRPPHGVP